MWGFMLQRFVFSSFCVLIMLAAGCSSDEPMTPEQEEKMKLFNIARLNGCMECHRINATVVGPSWEAISERYKDGPYEATRDMLVDSVLKGSRGKWITWKGGDGMPPLAKRVEKQVVVELSEYILNLKRKQASGEQATQLPAGK